MGDLKDFLSLNSAKICASRPHGSLRYDAETFQYDNPGKTPPQSMSVDLEYECHMMGDKVSYIDVVETPYTYHLDCDRSTEFTPIKSRICSPLFAHKCDEIFDQALPIDKTKKPRQTTKAEIQKIADAIFSETFNLSREDRELFASMIDNRVDHEGFKRGTLKTALQVVEVEGWKLKKSTPSKIDHPRAYQHSYELAKLLAQGRFKTIDTAVIYRSLKGQDKREEFSNPYFKALYLLETEDYMYYMVRPIVDGKEVIPGLPFEEESPAPESKPEKPKQEVPQKPEPQELPKREPSQDSAPKKPKKKTPFRGPKALA